MREYDLVIDDNYVNGRRQKKIDNDNDNMIR